MPFLGRGRDKYLGQVLRNGAFSECGNLANLAHGPHSEKRTFLDLWSQTFNSEGLQPEVETDGRGGATIISFAIELHYLTNARLGIAAIYINTLRLPIYIRTSRLLIGRDSHPAVFANRYTRCLHRFRCMSTYDVDAKYCFSKIITSQSYGGLPAF